MTPKALGRGYEIKDGRIVKKPVYHSVSQALKAKRTNRTKVRPAKRGELPR